MKIKKMNKKILLIACLLYANLSYANNQYLYQSYENLSLNKKSEFMKSLLNDRFEKIKKEPQTSAFQKIEGHCDKVIDISKISENNVLTHYKVSCNNLKEKWHVILMKIKTGYSIISPCSLDEKKFKKEVSCSSIKVDN